MKLKHTIKSIGTSVVALTVLLTLATGSSQARGTSFADTYYNEQMSGLLSSELPSQAYYNSHLSSELPSQAYYNRHLRGEWEEDGGPGGSGNGYNNAVGTLAVPVGDGIGVICFAGLVYAGILQANRWRQKKHNYS